MQITWKFSKSSGQTINLLLSWFILKKILFPTQLQENYEPSSINKIIMYKRKNRNFFPITWL